VFVPGSHSAWDEGETARLTGRTWVAIADLSLVLAVGLSTDRLALGEQGNGDMPLLGPGRSGKRSRAEGGALASSRYLNGVWLQTAAPLPRGLRQAYPAACLGVELLGSPRVLLWDRR
jgi:hypothetical protein